MATKPKQLIIGGNACLCVDEISTVVPLLTLLQQGGFDNEKQMLEEAKQLLNSASGDPLLPVVRILIDLIKIVHHKIEPQQSIWLHHEPLTIDPWHDLFQALALYWLEWPLHDKLIRRLLRHVNQPSGISQGYIAEVIALLFNAGIDSEQMLYLNATGFEKNAFLHDLYKNQFDWRQQLSNLQSLSKYFTDGKKEQTGPGREEGDVRMAWIINGENRVIQLSPREQKRNKKGAWSKGRRVSLKRLHEQRNQFDYLSAIDQKICNSMEVTQERNYSGYPETYYHLYGEKTIRAAIGHPALFFDDQTQIHGPLTIEEHTPHLQVQENPKRHQIHFSIRPYPEKTLDNRPSPFIGHFSAPNKILLTAFSEGQLAIAALLSEKGLTVPGEAKQEVANTLSSVAPLFSIRSDIGTDASSEPGDPTPHIHLYPISGCDREEELLNIGCGFELSIRCYPFGKKGGNDGPHFAPGSEHAGLHLQINGQQRSCQRDLQLEIETATAITRQLTLPEPNAPWCWMLDDPEDALELLCTLQQIEDPLVIAWPEGKRVSLLTERRSFQMSLSLGKQRDWFTLDGELAIDEEEVIEMRKLLSLLQQRPGRFLQLDDGRILTLSRQLRQQLDRISAISKGNRIHPLAAPIIEESTQEMRIKRGRGWHDQLKRIEQANRLQPTLPVTLDAELRSYQLEGFEWLARLAHWGAGGCLADDMGLGKTLQALALTLHRCAAGPTLVVAPTSVCNNWMEESTRFAPTLRPQLFAEGDRRQTLGDAGPFSLIICSYGLLQSEIQRIKKVEWQTIVADEAQAFKNSKTKRSQAMMSLQGKMRIITTGTPIENHLGELWNLYQFINPGLLGSKKSFDQHFATPIQEHNDDAARQNLKALVRPFLLRRLKRDVLTELPPRTEIVHSIEMSTEEAGFYEALRRQSIERIAEPHEHPGQLRFRILAEITRLRQAACHPRLLIEDSPIGSAKLRAFTEIIEELRENGHRALVFSQFVSHLSLIREALDGMHIHYQYLDGSTPIKQRKAVVAAFQQGEGELFLISLKAGGSGLNLTAADYVIHMDPWWNPAVEDQASDRAHRMGQARPVTIYRMVVKNSIEEKIIALHQQKRELANSLLEGSEHATQLSVDELAGLLGG